MLSRVPPHPGAGRDGHPLNPSCVPMDWGVPGTPSCCATPVCSTDGTGMGMGTEVASQGLLQNPRPQGPWLGLLVFPHRPDSRGIFTPQRIFLISRLHNSLLRTHTRPLISIASKALPTSPAAMLGLHQRGDIVVASRQGGDTDPLSSPQCGDPAPPGLSPGRKDGARSWP